MQNFDDLALAVSAFGGNNKVIFDDMEKPSIMVGIPKMKYSDVITGGTQEVLPWWIVDGVEKDVIWVSKYLNVVVNDRAYSLPLKDPKTYISFDEAVSVCRNKGNGWHLNQNGVFAAINLWCQRNGKVMRGNTNNSASEERKHERGITTYYMGSAAGGGRTATGSGPITWYHDGTPAGIADLCGNCWEWVSGLRIVNGEIQIIPYGNAMKNNCSMLENSTEWKAITPDGTLVEPGTEGTLHYDIITGELTLNTSCTIGTGNIGTEFNVIKVKTGVNIPKIVIAAGIYKDSADTFDGGNRQYINLESEQIACRGSSCLGKEAGGAAALALNYNRLKLSMDLSFRCAYVE